MISSVPQQAAVATATRAYRSPAASQPSSAEDASATDKLDLSDAAQAARITDGSLLKRIAAIRAEIEAGTYATDEKLNAIVGDIQSEIHQPRRIPLRA